MEQVLNNINAIGIWIYPLTITGMLIDGNITLLLIGFFITKDNLILIFFAFIGALIENIFWYSLGEKIKNSNSKIFLWAVEKTKYFDGHFLERPKITMLVSKFIYGAHRAAIIRAGIIGKDIKKYIEEMMPVLLLWMVILISLGFIFKTAFNLVKKYIGYAEIIFLVLLVGFIIFDRFFLSKKIQEKI